MLLRLSFSPPFLRIVSSFSSHTPYFHANFSLHTRTSPPVSNQTQITIPSDFLSVPPPLKNITICNDSPIKKETDTQFPISSWSMLVTPPSSDLMMMDGSEESLFSVTNPSDSESKKELPNSLFLFCQRFGHAQGYNWKDIWTYGNLEINQNGMDSEFHQSVPFEEVMKASVLCEGLKHAFLDLSKMSMNLACYEPWMYMQYSELWTKLVSQLDPVYLPWDDLGESFSINGKRLSVPEVWKFLNTFGPLTDIEFAQMLSVCFAYKKWEVFDAVFDDYCKLRTEAKDEDFAKMHRSSSKFISFLEYVKRNGCSEDAYFSNSVVYHEHDAVSNNFQLMGLIKFQKSFVKLYQRLYTLGGNGESSDVLSSIDAPTEIFWELFSGCTPSVVVKIALHLLAKELDSFRQSQLPEDSFLIVRFVIFILQDTLISNMKSVRFRYCIALVDAWVEQVPLFFEQWHAHARFKSGYEIAASRLRQVLFNGLLPVLSSWLSIQVAEERKEFDKPPTMKALTTRKGFVSQMPDLLRSVNRAAPLSSRRASATDNLYDHHFYQISFALISRKRSYQTTLYCYLGLRLSHLFATFGIDEDIGFLAINALQNRLNTVQGFVKK